MIKSVVILLCCVLLTACGGAKDPYASYRGERAHDIFQHAKKSLAKGHYQEATQQLEALDALFPFSAYAEQAQLYMIYAYYQNDDTALALASADRYIHLYPRSQHVDYAYYMRGHIEFYSGLNWLQKRVGVDPALRDTRHLKESFMSYYELAKHFPRSIYRKDAILRMRYLRNLLAEYELSVATFNYKHKAYVGAANRATYVVQHFSGSPLVKDALALNVKAYKAMRLDGLASDNQRVLEANFK